MRKAEIYRNGKLAGILTEESHDRYIFCYENAYFADSRQSSISLTLPKTQQKYESNCLFPFFFNMLSEGANRKLQCTQLRIDENDNFGLLMATAQHDATGAITVKPVVK
ncbi:MAG: HipA N-terminal domain-containing protein [Bacteroidales bacterium]|jgi:serine/threonine-protein kinase HipA|nr:HipA N-terminal domain-containing protein [Bacteroidales bacterium]